MLKEGKWRAVRNLPIGWITHANHGRDFSDMTAHYCAELCVLFILSVPTYFMEDHHCIAYYLTFLFLIVHTVWWVLNGNFHVCMLDSFKYVRNAGFHAVLEYIHWLGGVMEKTGAVEAILIYGSFCRGRFHGRSDLDLRIIRKKGMSSAIALFPVVVYARLVSLLRGIPTDLQFVDSEAFLLKQMRADEHPVCVYGKGNLRTIPSGLLFEEVKGHPEKVLREDALRECLGA
jgi:hypothetical protein